MAQASAPHFLKYGTQTIEYELTFAPRKTLAVQVHPDLSVIVKAPEGTDATLVEQKVLKRAAWIVKQQRQFELYLPDVPPRQYVSGESHRYLGRQYRLKVVEVSGGSTESVRLTRQFLYVETSDKQSVHVRKLVETWYREQASFVFQGRLDTCHAKLARFDIPYPGLVIRQMSTSWGNCSATGAISLNIKLIQVPVDYIDYVIIHELCHLKYLHHGPEFYKLLARALPDWQTKRDRLNRFDFG